MISDWLRGSVALAVSAAWLAFAAAAPAVLAYGERRAPRPAGSTTQIVPVVTQPTTGNAFDWIDAAIGGGVVLGLLLVAAGTALVVLRRAQQHVLVDIDPRRKDHDA